MAAIIGQEVDVLASFEIGTPLPKPLRFKLIEGPIKRTVAVSKISGAEQLGAGGASRIAYKCESLGVSGKPIAYTLLYFYKDHRWEIMR
jgi:hypothetical protein